jgi:hypothetical protein
MTTRTSCGIQRDWVSFGTLERRGKVSPSSPPCRLFKPINSRKLAKETLFDEKPFLYEP